MAKYKINLNDEDKYMCDCGSTDFKVLKHYGYSIECTKCEESLLLDFL